MALKTNRVLRFIWHSPLVEWPLAVLGERPCIRTASVTCLKVAWSQRFIGCSFLPLRVTSNVGYHRWAQAIISILAIHCQTFDSHSKSAAGSDSLPVF